MPFLLTFWKPIAILLLVGAVLAFVGVAKHRYDERRRDEGRAEIQGKWDAAITAQKAREVAAAAEADDFQRRANAKQQADFAAVLKRRTAERDAALAGRNISADLLAELRDTTRAANGQGAGEPAVAVSSAAGPAELAIRNWYDQVAALYRACRDHEVNWLQWDDNRVKQ